MTPPEPPVASDDPEKPASGPRSCGRRSPTDTATAVVVRVIAAKHHPSGRLLLDVDGDLTDEHVVLSEIRLIGRASTAPPTETYLITPVGAHRAARPFVRLPLGLPEDIRAGDLLVVPAHGTVTLHDVRLPRPHPAP